MLPSTALSHHAGFDTFHLFKYILDLDLASWVEQPGHGILSALVPSWGNQDKQDVGREW